MATVLVIDDEPAIRDSLKLVLERAGFAVVTAADGNSGLAAFRSRDTDVVIVDVIMPQSDGIAVIGRLRDSFPGARIIAITGGGHHGPLDYKPGTVVTDAFLELARKSGADAVLSKPFHRTDVLDLVRSLLRN